MNWLNKLERRFGRYAIQNLPLYVVLLYAVGLVLTIVTNGQASFFLCLNPYMVIHQHEYWRIISFIMMPPSTNLIFILFVLLFYYSIGQSLVAVWGAFRFNMYLFTGILFTILAAFVAYFITGNPAITLDTYYLNLSLFLAYAAIFPEMSVYLYGILPIKVKWLGYLDVVLLIYSFWIGSTGSRIAIVVSMLNFFLFFFSTRNYKKISPKEMQRKRSFKKQMQQASETGRSGSRHKCAICGRTEADDPDLQFRFCSKCEGNYEYCNDHLFTHTHVK